MHHTKAIFVAVGLTCFAAASASAAVHKTKSVTHPAATAAATAPQTGATAENYAELHHCGWVGPGGRAVYRCNLENPSQRPIVVSQDHTLHRVCDWIGPGGRAVYMCRYQ